MSEFSTLNEIFQKYLEDSDENFKKNILHTKIFKGWEEFAGTGLSEEVQPIKITGKTLVLYSDNPAAKNMIMFIANEIAEYLNKTVGGGEKIIEKVTFGKSFEKPDKKITKNKPKKISSEPDIAKEIAKIKLTRKEIMECEKKCVFIHDPDFREKVFQAHANFIRRKKFDIKHGKKKCALCDLYCDPEEEICDICKFKEGEKMRREVAKILRRNPGLSVKRIQTAIGKKFLYTAHKCNSDFIDSVRSDMVKEIAARIPYDDRESEEVKFLAMLYKKVSPGKLTGAIFNRAMRELKFNMANLPKFKMHKFKKL